MKKCLDLFSGTHSFTKVARELGYECVSLDISPKHSPDIVCDILEFDFTVWAPGTFEFIWASPPCTLFSVAAAHMFTEEERNQRFERGKAVARRALEVVEYLQPKWYVFENPLSSAIWKIGLYDHLPKKKLSYCHYGFPYRKNTMLATNVDFDAKFCRYDCEFVRIFIDAQGKPHRHHAEIAQHGPSGSVKHLGVQTANYSQDDLYKVPFKIIRDILHALPPQVETPTNEAAAAQDLSQASPFA